MIKITGGKFKNQSLETLSKFVRPTSSLKREAFFSIIQSYMLQEKIDLFQEKIFLDLFAGFGTMGLEAISRGMKKSIFYENNQKVIGVLKINCKKFCKSEQYKIIKKDISILNIDEDFNHISIVYLDPPYNLYNISELLLKLQDKILKNCIVAVETSIKNDYFIPDKLRILKNKRYGKTKINFLVLS